MSKKKVVALSGGVGGAKLASGLSRIVEGDNLFIIANTGDDFEHLGFHISPDIDTLVYTLAGLNNEEVGWGRRGETWTFMQVLESLGGETWFRLGDGDLAMHVERTGRLGRGETLAQITDGIAKRLGIAAKILPMTNDRVRTRVKTDAGWIDFQEYFVKHQCRPTALDFAFEGASVATLNPEILELLADPELRAVIICPSNPYISIDPILSLPGMRDALARCAAPIVGVAPIIGGKAVKGPLAKIMNERGIEVSPVAVARHYRDFLDAFVVDHSDASAMAGIQIEIVAAQALMSTVMDKANLANAALRVADRGLIRRKS